MDSPGTAAVSRVMFDFHGTLVDHRDSRAWIEAAVQLMASTPGRREGLDPEMVPAFTEHVEQMWRHARTIDPDSSRDLSQVRTVRSSSRRMNPDMVESQARILHGLSGEITTLLQKIEGEVSELAAAWHGDDSRKFATEWAGTHKPVFTTAATLLADMGNTSQRSAAQQRITSST